MWACQIWWEKYLLSSGFVVVFVVFVVVVLDKVSLYWY